MADGFEGASVDDIAKVAGVSKATLYSYFPDKRLLFMEVARLECAAPGRNRDHPHADVRRSARRAVRGGVAHGAVLPVPLGRQTYRIAVAETERFPEIGRQFYNSGPTLARQALTAVFPRSRRGGRTGDRRHRPGRRPVHRAVQGLAACPDDDGHPDRLHRRRDRPRDRRRGRDVPGAVWGVGRGSPRRAALANRKSLAGCVISRTNPHQSHFTASRSGTARQLHLESGLSPHRNQGLPFPHGCPGQKRFSDCGFVKRVSVVSVRGHGSLRGRGCLRLMMVFGGGSSPMSFAGWAVRLRPNRFYEIDQPPSRRDFASRLSGGNSDQAVASFVHW